MEALEEKFGNYDEDGDVADSLGTLVTSIDYCERFFSLQSIL